MKHFIKTVSVFTAAVILCMSCVCLAAASDTIRPSSWAATDGLGRTLTLNEGEREEKFVGMFYWIWHYPWCDDWYPINTTEILKAHPEAKYDFENAAWGNYSDGVPQFWDEPLFGYYSDLDEYVLRKHAELLADADIDVIVFDCTNGTNLFEDGYEKLFKVWEEAKQDGVNVPQVSFMLPFGDKEYIHTDLVNLYDNIYSEGRYKDLWFIWQGKPLIMADSSSLDKRDSTDRTILNFFTFRKNESTYFANDTLYNKIGKNTWGWCSEYPQTLFGKKSLFSKTAEQICVSVAQNCNEKGLCAMNCAEGTVQGRSYARGDYSYSFDYQNRKVTVDKNTDNLLYYGLNFQQQWDYAIEADPDFIFVTGFNEWIAGRFREWCGTENASPDQFSPEYSRDIEPSKGELKDYYYYQLVENVRRFKGSANAGRNEAEKTIDITAGTKQWESVYPEYAHYTGSTRTRNSAGWKGTFYENSTARNDIVSAKVAYDKDNIYFIVRTAENLTPSTDSAWMRLFIDTDFSGVSPNWESFEYVINRQSPSDGKVTVEKSNGGWNFDKTGEGLFAVDGNILQLEIPREALGLDNTETVRFNFKWSDNMQTDGDVMDFYENGDVAPGGRFAFVFDSAETGEQKENARGETAGIFEKIKIFFKSIFAFLKRKNVC